jgi:hypothetical protein
MAKNQARFVIENEGGKPSPLAPVEKAAIERGEADIKAGRVYDHDQVAELLRRRAAKIVGRANQHSQELTR